MNTKRLAIFLFLIIIIATSIYLYAHPKLDKQSVAALETSEPGKFPKEFQDISLNKRAEYANAPNQEAAPKAETASSSKIVSLYNNSKKDRAFVLQAWDMPNEGGRFYASFIVDRCAALRKGTDVLQLAQPDISIVGQENYLKASKAFQSIQDRCGQFSSDEYAKYSSLPLLNAPPGERDRLVDAISSYTKPPNAEAKASALKDLMELGDPLAFDSLGMRIAATRDEGGIHIFFDGKKYYVNDQPAIAEAFYLLPCGLGLQCDSSEPDLELSCVAGSGCYSSRFDKVAQNLGGRNSSRFQEVMESYNALVSAIKSKEATKFPNK